MKTLKAVHKAPAQHWVGDGFAVQTMFSYPSHGDAMSPFLMLDYAAPHEFAPTDARRGVGTHPHRGFETVTIVYAGEVEHRDSGGNAGKIGPGDVQWMTAASGVVHEEFHSREFGARGGPMEMVQLWVNLPASDKLGAPRYQGIVDADIPSVALHDGASRVRVIAGEFRGVRGPALTFTPVTLLDVRLAGGQTLELPAAHGHTTAVLVQSGAVSVDGKRVGHGEFAEFSRDGERVTLTADADSKVLLLAGEPIAEPIAGYGPFVMNTPAEIQQAIIDFQSGRMGALN